MRAVIHHSIEAIDFGINSGIEAEKTARFARRMGYRGVGENLVKESALQNSLPLRRRSTARHAALVR